MKNKKIIISLSVGGILLTLFIILNYFNNNGVVIASDKSDSIMNSNTLTMMYETGKGTGEYQVSNDNTWPGEPYEFNENLSKCENGSELTWNEETKKVTLKANVSDKCYVYFDYNPKPTVTLATNYSTITANTPATLSCSNATASYNQKYGRIEVSQISSKQGNCTLTYQTPSSKQYLNTYITGLSGSTQGDGQVVNENGYRYEGKNPNNYIWFNNELWRIIGVFDSVSHGQSGEILVKIIRENSLGVLTWDKTGDLDWTKASLKNLLNKEYLNAQDGTDSGNCYGYSTTVPSNCDYTNIGINSTYRNMIANVTWHLGGGSTGTADTCYNLEMNSDKYGEFSEVPTTNWEGKIGLMYVSDYMYSTLASVCSRTTELDMYNDPEHSPTCIGENWLFGEGREFTISVQLGFVEIITVNSIDGDILWTRGSRYGYFIRPVLYLNSKVYVVDGNGTESDPYIIGM